MKEEGYTDQLHQAWAGEVQGEAFFTTLAELATDARVSSKWRDLAELERLVGNTLQPLVIPTHVDTGPSEAVAAQLSQQTFTDVLKSIADVIDSAVERYNALRDSGPRRHARELDILARHEVALQTFVRRELQGDAVGSLQEAQQLLNELRNDWNKN